MTNLEHQKIALGKVLMGARTSLGLSRADVGRRIGRNRTLVNRYELGSIEPTALMLLRLAGELQISLTSLATIVRKAGSASGRRANG